MDSMKNTKPVEINPLLERRVKVGDIMMVGTRLKFYTDESKFNWTGAKEIGSKIMVTEVWGDVRVQLA